MNWGTFAASSRPSALVSSQGLSSINSWTTNNGIGQLLSNQNQTGARALIRGGNSGSNSSTGVLAVALSILPSNSGAGFGFRVAK